MISITVNGGPRQIGDDTSIIALLELLEIDRRRVAVAVNGEVVPKTEHASVMLQYGDAVEIVRMVGGGARGTRTRNQEPGTGTATRGASTTLSAGPRRSAEGDDVVIVGAGIIGCAIADELTRRGVSSTLIDSRRLGMAATNAAAGILAPLAEFQRPGPLVELGVRSLRLYPEWVERLKNEVPEIDTEYQLTGVLRVAFTDEELRELRKGLRYRDEVGLDLIDIDQTLLRELEPRISPDALGGVMCPEEGQVSNQLFALALARAAKQRGARIIERDPVVGFRKSRDRVTAVRTESGEHGCDRLVLAAGPWTRPLAAKLGVEVPTRPMRGQMIALGGMRAPVRHVVWGPRGYLVPRANGLVFAGATVEDVGFRFRTTRRGLANVRRAAIELVPQLRQAQHHFDWFGLRPGSPDGLPMLGALPGWENVTVATGHFRNGVLLAPVTGELIADEIVAGRPNEASGRAAVGPLAAFRPGRFL